MYFVKPSPLSLNFSNVLASTETEYSSTSTYGIDDIVQVSSSPPVHIYKSLVTDNKDNFPASSPLSWEDLGVTNRWAMFDDKNMSQTTNKESIDVFFSAPDVDTICVLNADAAKLRIVSKYAGNIISDQTTRMVYRSGGKIVDYYSYFVARILKKTAAFISVPKRSSCSFQATLTGSMVKCGVLSAGRRVDIGTTKWGVSMGIKDYSIKNSLSTGEEYLAQGAYSKKVTLVARLTDAEIEMVYESLAGIRATPVLWNCDNRDDALAPLLIFGKYNDFGIIAQGINDSLCNLEIEGLI
jgi:hypothetical protein